MNSELSSLKIDLSLAYSRFTQLAEMLYPDKQIQSGVSGKWSAKDVISHLVGWDKSLCDFITNPDNFNPEPLYDIHAFNAKSVSDRHAQTWEMTMAELQRTFSNLEKAIVSVTPDMKIYARVMSWLSGRIDDYRFHSIQLEEWMERNQETPT